MMIDLADLCQQEKDNLRPRLCHIKKVENTYGFNLHSKKSEQGQFIKTVDEDSPAQKAGLKPHDKIIQVNTSPHCCTVKPCIVFC